MKILLLICISFISITSLKADEFHDTMKLFQSNLDSFDIINCKFILIQTTVESLEDIKTEKWKSVPMTAKGYWYKDGQHSVIKIFEDANITKALLEKPTALKDRPNMMISKSVPFKNVQEAMNENISMVFTGKHASIQENIYNSRFAVEQTPFGMISHGSSKSLTKLVEYAKKGEIKYEVKKQSVDGHMYVVVKLYQGDLTRSVYFNPAFGYLPTTTQFVFKNSKQEMTLEVEPKECTGGKWFPNKVIFTLKKEKDYKVKICKVLELDTQTHPKSSDLKLDIPAGTTIFNPKIKGSSFRCIKNEEVGMSNLNEIFKMAKNKPTNKLMDTNLPINKSFYARNNLLVVLSIGCCCIAIIFIGRKIKRKFVNQIV